MRIRTIQKEKRFKNNFKYFLTKIKLNANKIIKKNPNIDILVVNHGNVKDLEQYDIDKVIKIFLPLKTKKNPLIIEASYRKFYNGSISEIQYTVTHSTCIFKLPFWKTKKYLIRTLFHYSSELYTVDEILIYDTSFKQDGWKFYDYIIDKELYKNIFSNTGPSEYTVHKDQPELGFYQAIDNPNYYPAPEPDSCKMCTYYAHSAYINCAVNPGCNELCRDYVRE
jgi:hypothetical protein